MNSRSDPDNGHVFGLAIRITQVLGMGMIILGVAIAMGFGGLLSPELGIFIAVLGLIEFFALPAVLRRVITAKRDSFLVGHRPENREGR